MDERRNDDRWTGLFVQALDEPSPEFAESVRERIRSRTRERGGGEPRLPATLPKRSIFLRGAVALAVAATVAAVLLSIRSGDDAATTPAKEDRILEADAGSPAGRRLPVRVVPVRGHGREAKLSLMELIADSDVVISGRIGGSAAAPEFTLDRILVGERDAGSDPVLLTRGILLPSSIGSGGRPHVVIFGQVTEDGIRISSLSRLIAFRDLEARRRIEERITSCRSEGAAESIADLIRTLHADSGVPGRPAEPLSELGLLARDLRMAGGLAGMLELMELALRPDLRDPTAVLLHELGAVPGPGRLQSPRQAAEEAREEMRKTLEWAREHLPPEQLRELEEQIRLLTEQVGRDLPSLEDLPTTTAPAMDPVACERRIRSLAVVLGAEVAITAAPDRGELWRAANELRVALYRRVLFAGNAALDARAEALAAFRRRFPAALSSREILDLVTDRSLPPVLRAMAVDLCRIRMLVEAEPALRALLTERPSDEKPAQAWRFSKVDFDDLRAGARSVLEALGEGTRPLKRR